MLKTFKKAFPSTLPVMAGYLFLGAAYGMSMRENGFGAMWSGLISTIVYGGSMQFAMIPSLCEAFAPFTILLLTLLIQARHIFYGLSMLDKYANIRASKWYLIFSLTDETFSLAVNGAPKDADAGKWYLAVSLMNHAYWVTGSLVGGLLGEVIPMNWIQGIDFAMTALFTVILTEQILNAIHAVRDGKLSAAQAVFPPLLGMGATLLSLLIVGKSSFLLLSMAMILTGFFLYRTAEKGRKRV